VNADQLRRVVRSWSASPTTTAGHAGHVQRDPSVSTVIHADEGNCLEGTGRTTAWPQWRTPMDGAVMVVVLSSWDR
jgi:hypothetical protein